MELQKLIDGLKAHKSGAAAYESVDEAIRVFEAMRDVDGEKVCKGLECHSATGTCAEECPYYSPAICSEPLCRDALVLIRQQQERIKELEAAQKWISVKDRLPPMYHMVLITGKNSAGGSFGVIKGSHDGDKGQWYRDDIGSYVDSRGDTVTHWMPLPSTEGLNGT